MKILTLMLGLLWVVVTGAVNAADIRVENAWARATAPGLPTGTVYFDLINTAARGDQLIGVSTARAPRAEIHRTIESSGNSQMVHTPTVRIPAEQSVTFAPTGRHIMLMGLTQALAEGERFTLTLAFSSAEPIVVEVEVKAPTAMDH
jgi:copper(I)-binding protein